MAIRIVGKRSKPDADPIEVYRFDTLAEPIAPAQRFAFGRWRDFAKNGAPSVASLVGQVQRGLFVDLPVESFGQLDAGVSRVERFYMTYAKDMANAVVGARGEARSWEPLVAEQPMHLITLTRFTLGSHSWFVVERGTIEPIRGRIAIDGLIDGGVQASVFSVESAARKAFTQWYTQVEQGDERLVAYPPTAQADAFGTVTNARIAHGLALHWMEKHAAEERKREEERKAAEAAARALEEQRERERLEEEERRRRIASGDVSVLDDNALAAKLRAKRAKGGAS
jgi:hypothetical protein